MKKKLFELPAMYGDHHVLEVRRILSEIPGVQDVYASSAFQVVEVSYDENKVNDLELAMRLDEAGYLGEWTPTSEQDQPANTMAKEDVFFRHTEVFETTKQVVGFTQTVNYVGRPLWPCPGMGAVRHIEEEN